MHLNVFDVAFIHVFFKDDKKIVDASSLVHVNRSQKLYYLSSYNRRTYIILLVYYRNRHANDVFGVVCDKICERRTRD